MSISKIKAIIEISIRNIFLIILFSVNSGSSLYKGAGTSLKKTSGTVQRQGTAYKIYACGMMGSVNKPEILIPLETIVILAH